jgi:hypothetical protein
MKRILDLRFLFTVVAVLELIYALAGVLTPPGMVQSVTGWVLTADGQWVAKLMGVALASQAWIAWMFRTAPHTGVAKALALYQIGSATADWVMWLALSDQQIFSTTLGKITVVASILLHYTLGLLLVLGIRVKRSADYVVPAHL